MSAYDYFIVRSGPGGYQSAVVGAGVLGACFAAVAWLWAWHCARRWARQRGKMEPCAAAALRLAAATGNLNVLTALDSQPTFDIDADLDGFTPLLAAAAEGQAGQSCELTAAALTGGRHQSCAAV